MITFVLGTKAELIKTMPIMKELEKRNIDYYFIHTGQHSIIDLVKDFEIKEPDATLYTPPKLSSRFMVKTHKAIFWGLSGIPRILREIRSVEPEFVCYHGDTLSTAMASVASSQALNVNKKWKNVHLEAGLRSDDVWEPYPEEISRRIADRFSDILFAVSKGAVENLKKEKLKGRIIHVGNTIIDSALISLTMANRKLGKLKEKNFCLINIHRHENIKSKERLGKIVNIITSVDTQTYWPLHDNTKQQLVKFGLMKKIKKKKNIKISRVVPYLKFIRLLANCKYLITDGGSIQEESLALKKPCILLRMKTERDEGLKTGINFLTKLNVNYATKLIKEFESKKFKIPKFKNPYGDGRAAKKIVDFIEVKN
ncbi:MAG: UDP-N-acetylglucosamine 2-epimerase (non-hydrolyzing) [Candidatus Aenigmarchaeota archaeon]|nr:UDP-N-acetylglucosamine 2-epimerase (non-hydrolyzing) [Candidatus Aenigmarchaeota archaeon]